MDLASVLKNFGASPRTVTRRTSNGYTNGRRDEPTSTTLSVLSLVQPMSGRELDRAPEGLQDRELRVVYTVEALVVRSDEHEPDLIEIDGASWEVQTSEDWSELGNYRRSIVARV